METKELREKLAALAHDQWASWMKFLFSRCNLQEEDGAAIIPTAFVTHWKKQMATPYASLSEYEKDSDRKEADRVIAILEAQEVGDEEQKELLKHFNDLVDEADEAMMPFPSCLALDDKIRALILAPRPKARVKKITEMELRIALNDIVEHNDMGQLLDLLRAHGVPVEGDLLKPGESDPRD